MNLIQLAMNDLSARVSAAYARCVAKGELPDGAAAPTAEIPRDVSHGDLCTPFALAAARTLKRPPRAVAEAIVENLELENSFFASASIAGAGFINVLYAPKWAGAVLKAVEQEGGAYGHLDEGAGKKVMVEFVSANPTGPMTIGNARGGVLGDTLASLLAADGYEVWREFYLNDAGHQIDVLGKSLEARYLQALGKEAEFPEDGYHGDYVGDFAGQYLAENGDSLLALEPEARQKALVDFVLPQNVEAMRRDLKRYRITFDRFFAESELHESGYVDETIDLLTKRGHTYEQDGALWFKSTAFGSEKDDVLRKSNGFYTYYAVDIAYHRDKFERRGFDTVIDVLGADHHGHTVRFRAGIAALGIEPERLQFVLMQLVRLTRDGEIVRMSKRTGKAITLSDLLDEIPVDAARFFFNLRQPDTHLEFDMGLAVQQTQENPVYYVQYAHARICTMLDLLGDTAGEVDAALLEQPTERELLRHIAQYPEEISQAARAYEPSRINRYAIELAARFHRFYNACRIKEAEPDLRNARLALTLATRRTLRNALELLGIDAPTKM